MKHVNIILRKDLRAYFESPIAYIFIIIFLLLTGIYFVSNLFLQNVSSLKSLFEVTPFLLLFFAPAITMRLISEEKKTGTYEVLSTKPIKAGEIIVGKFFAALLLVILAMLPTLFYLLTIAIIGTVDIGPVIGGYIGLLLLGAAFIAIGVLGSTLSENQIVSFIFGFVIILMLFGIGKVLIYLPMKLVPAVEYLSVDHHISAFTRGVLDSRDIVYFLSLIGLSLLLASILVEVETVGTVLKLRSFGWKQQLPRLGLVIVILVFVNLLSFKIFTRADLTSNKAYTLTQTTKNLLSSLDDDFLVKAYFSPDIPPPYQNHRQFVQEELDEYRAFAPGKFHYQFLDPMSDADAEREALQQGITPVQVKVIKNDKFLTEKAYVGLAFSYGDRTERLPVVQSVQQLEYYITSSMKKLMAPQERKVAFLQGQGEPVVDKMSEFRKELSKRYAVTTVNGSTKQIPSDISALIVTSPKSRFTDREKYNVDQFIMRGGKCAFFMDNVSVDKQMQQARAADLNLDDMFDAYGWIINPDLVVDGRCLNLTVSWDSSSSSTPTDVAYPFFPIVSDFNPTNLTVKDLSPVAFSYVSSLDVRLSAIRGVNAEVVLTTSTQSRRLAGDVIVVDPRVPLPTGSFSEAHIPVAAAIDGSFKSLYAKRRIAIDEKTQASGVDESPFVGGSPATRIVIVGDGDFLLDDNIHGYGNVAFASSLVDWLFDDIGLNSIRSRDPEPKPLNDISEGTKIFFKYLNFAAPPTVIVLAGVLRLMRKSARRKKHQQSF
ncbi:MAG: Gldg family protein [Bacteroidota bacterium]|jgi:ABC-2 type transport system permease protein